MTGAGSAEADDRSATSNSNPCSLRMPSTVYPGGIASALRGGFLPIALRRLRLRGFFPWRFMVRRKKPFNSIACQLITSPFAPQKINYALHATEARSAYRESARFGRFLFI